MSLGPSIRTFFDSGPSRTCSTPNFLSSTGAYEDSRWVHRSYFRSQCCSTLPLYCPFHFPHFCLLCLPSSEQESFAMSKPTPNPSALNLLQSVSADGEDKCTDRALPGRLIETSGDGLSRAEDVSATVQTRFRAFMVGMACRSHWMVFLLKR